ncbi:hypothetical protein VIN01S_16770 [Vibrio inusitatus NBRC 102082]|uniref:Uncharacterized protein n=1 Tax=Vibrio inusitatus NBRC 102082 TaxID=1219070 RepID=A0A4Y3HUN6_9VIBR|nr:hypothetical protein [Vibrio inusitatus]GEA50873.1 hypothetical protein VIN01S_16770 [Vibrio inusitatus NBRC 102082]
MAAEKLTKGRLIQIIVTFTVLIVAFTWRTFEHSDNKSVNETSCIAVNSCRFEFNRNDYLLELDTEKGAFRVIRTSKLENDDFVEFKGESHHISEFISLASSRQFSFTMINGEQILQVYVNDK